MSKRVSISANTNAAKVAAAAATARRLEQVREKSADTEGEPMTTASIHLPVALLTALRDAANRRANRRATEDARGRGGRPSVSSIVVELLQRHRAELDGLD